MDIFFCKLRLRYDKKVKCWLFDKEGRLIDE